MTKSIYSLFSTKKISDIPQISRFTVERNSAFVGYKCRLRWVYDDPSIIGFKIWKSNSPKVLLKKDYSISQVALERTTGLKSRDPQGTALYNKSFYSQNSKVKFFNSESSRYDKPNEKEEATETATYTEIGFVSKNQIGQYEFVDGRVKFGETYYYCITCINIDFFESAPSDPVEVSIEDTRHPDPPTDIKIIPGGSTIVLKIKNNKNIEDIEKYKIYRREQDEKEFKFLIDAPATGDIVSVIDSSILPSVRYFYKIYSVDFFGNVSFSSEEHSVVNGSFLPIKSDTKFPDFDLTVDSGDVYIKGLINSSGTIGHKIERSDSWKFEKGFELKKYNEIQWPRLNRFDQSGSYVFIDRGIDLERVYRYRITAVGKNGKDLRNFITPHIKMENNLQYSFRDSKQLQTGSVVITNFSAEVLDRKEFPLFTKIEWAIEGNWAYLNLEINKVSSNDRQSSIENLKTIKIDNIHNYIYYEGLEEGNTYILKLKVFDIDGDTVAATDYDNDIKVIL